MLYSLTQHLEEGRILAYKKFLEKLHKEDEEYYESGDWKNDGYSSYGFREKTVITAQGELQITRRYYYHKKKKHGYFYIDEQYDLEKGQRIGEDVKQIVFETFGKLSAVDIAKSFGVSRQTVYNILNSLGRREIKQEIEPDRSVEKVFIHADEDHIKNQKQDKRNSQARMIVVYTDRVRLNKGKYALLNKRYFLFTQDEDFYEKWEEVNDYISMAYPNCKVIYCGSDGGGWIKASRQVLPKKQTLYIYDLFHFTQSLTRIFGSSANGNQLKITASEYVKNDAKEEFIKLTEAWFVSMKTYQVGKMRNRRAEFKKVLNHWDEIRNNWRLKDYHGTSAEGHVSHYLSARFSSRPKGFSLSRLKAYVKVTEYQLNGIRFDQVRNGELRTAEELFVLKSAKQQDVKATHYNNRSSVLAPLNHSTDARLRTLLGRIASGR